MCPLRIELQSLESGGRSGDVCLAAVDDMSFHRIRADAGTALIAAQQTPSSCLGCVGAEEARCLAEMDLKKHVSGTQSMQRPSLLPLMRNVYKAYLFKCNYVSN